MSNNSTNQIDSTEKIIERNINTNSNISTLPFRSNFQTESIVSNLQSETIPIACSCLFSNHGNFQFKQNLLTNNTNYLSSKNSQFENLLEDKKRDVLILKEAEPKQLVNKLRSRKEGK
jgi:hypothetical protein